MAPQPIQDPGYLFVQAPSRPPEPVFVDPPPDSQRVRRVLHSEIYLKYIEGLHDRNQTTVTKWDRSVQSARVVAPNRERLPTDWLSPNVPQEDVVQALCNLRDYMTRDALNIARVLDATEW